jgi:hypothetical protein
MSSSVAYRLNKTGLHWCPAAAIAAAAAGGRKALAV